jgi:hypothetical protein
VCLGAWGRGFFVPDKFLEFLAGGGPVRAQDAHGRLQGRKDIAFAVCQPDGFLFDLRGVDDDVGVDGRVAAMVDGLDFACASAVYGSDRLGRAVGAGQVGHGYTWKTQSPVNYFAK